MARAAGLAFFEGCELRSLGVIRAQTGQPGQAAALLSQAAEIARRLGDLRSLALALSWLATVYLHAGRHPAAAAAVQEANDALRCNGELAGQPCAADPAGGS